MVGCTDTDTDPLKDEVLKYTNYTRATPFEDPKRHICVQTRKHRLGQTAEPVHCTCLRAVNESLDAWRERPTWRVCPAPWNTLQEICSGFAYGPRPDTSVLSGHKGH